MSFLSFCVHVQRHGEILEMERRRYWNPAVRRTQGLPGPGLLVVQPPLSPPFLDAI